jgi:hypothetical protein
MFPQSLVAGVDGAGLFQFIWKRQHSDHWVSANLLRGFAADYMFCTGPLHQSKSYSAGITEQVHVLHSPVSEKENWL